MSEHTPELGEARNLYADGLIAFWGSHDTPIRRSEAVAEFDRFIAKVKADAWDEGESDGVWNHEHASMIDRGNREAITNPYRTEGES